MQLKTLYDKGKPVYSLEVFPPRNGESLDKLYQTIDELLSFDPAFISVTGGALGSRRGGTLAIAAEIKRRSGIEGVPHFTCVNRSKQDIENLLVSMKYLGIENVFALRGDPAEGQDKFVPHPEGHRYASQLVEQIKLLNKGIYNDDPKGKEITGLPVNLGIAVAGYPDCHPECSDLQKDIQNLKIKVDSGADYIVTQMAFNAESYLNFRDKAVEAGIEIPIVAGIMPLETYGQVNFLTKQMEIPLPAELRNSLEQFKDDKSAVRQMLEEHNMRLCRELVDKGISGLQLFTMNKSEPTYKILKELV